MKKGIHPQLVDTKFKCACGNVIETRSLQDEVKLEICSACHPFYTGKQKLVDSAGRVERFMKKYGDKAAKADDANATKKPKQKKVAPRSRKPSTTRKTVKPAKKADSEAKSSAAKRTGVSKKSDSTKSSGTENSTEASE